MTRWLSILTLAVAIGGCTRHPTDAEKRTVPQNMHTYCVGRALIDLPEGTTWDGSTATIGSIDVHTTLGVTKAQFDTMIEKRWQELQSYKADSFGKAWDKPSQRIDIPKQGVVFSYEWASINGPDLNGVWTRDVTHSAKGYVWHDGTLFTMAKKFNAKKAITNLMPHLHARQPDELPRAIVKSGVCGRNRHDQAASA